MKLYCDLHIHSCLSPCGDQLMTPNNIVGMAYIKGLDVIAVCDHNSARNLPAVKEAADMMGVVLLPGMELTTKEEVHMLCYFESVEKCMIFGDYIYQFLPDIPNNAAFFGEQQVLNGQDEEIAKEEKLLISGLDLSFEECERQIHLHGGICVPAHINRGSNGVMNALGFLPGDVKYDALEVSDKVAPPNMDVSAYTVLKSSDAHYLENILEREFTLETEAKTAKAVFDAIRGGVKGHP